MIYIESTTDFEFYSGTSKGAIQGYGYVFASGEFAILEGIMRCWMNDANLFLMGCSWYLRVRLLYPPPKWNYADDRLDHESYVFTR